MQVGSAVLLLSRFVGLQWNADEALRLAEEKTASASEAVNRLSDNVGTLEQRLTAAEEPITEDAKGEPVGGGGGGGAAPTHPSPARTGSVAHGAQLADGGSGGSTPPGDAGDGVVLLSPSLSQNKSLDAAAGTAPVAREAEAGAKRSGSDREDGSDHKLQQASTADSTRKQRPSAPSRGGGDKESGGDVAPPSASRRSDDDVSAGNRDGGISEGSSASAAAEVGRRHNGAPDRDIDSDDERGSSRRRSSGGGSTDGEDRRKEGPSRRSVEARPVDRPLSDAAAQQDVSSSSSTRKNRDDEELRPLRRSRVSVVADGGGDSSSSAVGTRLNPAPDEPAGEPAAAATVLAEEENEQAARDGLKGARSSSTASEKSAADAAIAAVTAAGELDSSVAEDSAAETEGGRKNSHAGRVEADKEGGAKKRTDDEASSAGPTSTEARPRNRTSVSETPRADELDPSASDRKEALAMDQNGAQDTHGSDPRQDEENGTTSHTTAQAVAARNTGTTATTPAVLARSSSSSTSESGIVGSPGGSGEEGSAAKKGADEKKRNGDADDEIRVQGDGEHGRSNSATREPGSMSASTTGTAPLDNEARVSSPSIGPVQPAGRPFDAPKAASSSIKLVPLEPRSTGGGSAEVAAEVSETTTSAGRIHGGLPHDARLAKTRVSKDVEDGAGAERPLSSGRLSARRQEAGSTAAPSRNAETGLAPVVSEVSAGKRGDIERGSGGGRGFSDDSSHTSGGSNSWTGRTRETRSSFSEESTAASTRSSSPSEKGRTADSAAVKRRSSRGSSSGGRRRRSRSRSKKNQVVADVLVGGTTAEGHTRRSGR